ncbi:MAG: carbamoyl-phosphate synthase large subunit, partial [Maricaulaceae bacterium]
MKSVGEAMAMGRTFQESLQKALRSLETGLTGFDDVAVAGGGGQDEADAVRAELAKPTSDRLLLVAQAFRLGLDVETVHQACFIDPWFLREIKAIVDEEERLKREGAPVDAEDWMALKMMGFSDTRLGHLTGLGEQEVRDRRRGVGVTPVYKRVDTCAAEFRAKTPYLYSTYETGLFGDAAACESRPSNAKKIIILGGGPNRIGQGIEFDYCCCWAAFACRDLGVESIMINCNPETVSTDYDTSDRLYFEPLTAETVLDVIAAEQDHGELLGVIVQFGGQTPLKLAEALDAAGVPILGTSRDAIDLAEDRERFKALIDRLGLKQPPSAIARSAEAAGEAAAELGFPLVLRPSYVLGGRAMEIVRDQDALSRYIASAMRVSGDSPLLIDSYLANATEVDLDAICDGEDIFVAGVMEHIEEAGIHSGDSACALPPYSLEPETIQALEVQAKQLALGLGVRGLMNVQFAIQGDDVFVLEVNPRASRTVPFVAKTVGLPVAGLAAKVMAGATLKDLGLNKPAIEHLAVKEAVFPFARFAGVDPVLGPEMRSTGEVMGIDGVFEAAFAKSQLAAGVALPRAGTVFISVRDTDKDAMVGLARQLAALDFKIVATGGTARHLAEAGLLVRGVHKVYEGRPNIVDEMKNGQVQLVFNTTEGRQSLLDSFDIRRTALEKNIPYYTTVAAARAAVNAIRTIDASALEVRALQDYTFWPLGGP